MHLGLFPLKSWATMTNDLSLKQHKKLETFEQTLTTSRSYNFRSYFKILLV